MRFRNVLSATLFCFALPAQQTPRPVPPEPPGSVKPKTHPAPVEPRPAEGKTARAPEAVPGFDVNAIDRAANPCVDFYQFACGTWMAQNPVPADQSRWGRFQVLEERNRETLRVILDESARPGGVRSALEQKVGDYYAACMDVAAIDRKGTAPLETTLQAIRGMADKGGLAAVLAEMHRAGDGALFDFGSGPDFKNSSQNIAQADQGGLGMPDRDYYLKADPRSVELREKYRTHVQRMFELLGHARAQAKAEADTVLRMETELAKNSLDRVERREPDKVYHKVSRQALAGMAPSFGWARYFAAAGAPAFESVNVAVPAFFRGLEPLLGSASLDDWKTYLTWHVLHSRAPLLPTPFVEENFAFFGRTLSGAKELRPRWKRCVDFTDNQLGEALGQRFVERTFGTEGKQRTVEMVQAIEKALGADIRQLGWMTDTTKQKALEKLQAITNKIGYPDKWRDYSSLRIARDDAMGNTVRADEFEFRRQIAKIGRPVDRAEWFMTPPTVNAYYSPEMNNINFPAGILQPPFYSNQTDDAVNFGGIGAVIGHELTHGFDDEGRHFDAQGNLQDWWTEQDGSQFEKHAQCFVDEYAGFTVAGGVHLNGKLTLGENTADNGGVRLAYMALLDRLAGATPGRIDGFTPEQRFFLGFGQIWCQNVTPEAARLRAQTDPHSPGQYRVNGTVQNMPEFWKAFGCTPGQPMVRPQACRVW